MVGFFFVVPVLLVFIYLFFHLALQRLGESLAELPVVFPTGRSRELAGPWGRFGLFSGQVAKETSRGGRPLAFLERAISRFLSDWIPPAALVIFWARYLVLQMCGPRFCTLFCWLGRPHLRSTSGAQP